MKYFLIAFFCAVNTDMGKFWNNRIPSNKSLESDTFDRLHTEMDKNYVGDNAVGSLSPLGSQQQVSQRFSWSVRNVAILACLCFVVILSFGALSMVASFYPHEVSLVIGEQLIVKHITLAFYIGYVLKMFNTTKLVITRK